MKVPIIKSTYATYRTVSSFFPETPDDSKTFCAWCHKSVAEIGRDNLDKHIDEHDKEDRKQKEEVTGAR
jgi:hypothetical protein